MIYINVNLIAQYCWKNRNRDRFKVQNPRNIHITSKLRLHGGSFVGFGMYSAVRGDWFG